MKQEDLCLPVFFFILYPDAELKNHLLQSRGGL